MQTFEVNGKPFNGQLCLPPTGSGSGVILLHAWWGLNPFFIETCEMLAEQGFVSLAPDYYSGRIALTIDEAEACLRKFERKQANTLVGLSVDYLSKQPFTSGSGLGVIGFSLGAGFAIEAARSRNQAIKAVVLFYGSGDGKFNMTQAAFQGHFATHGEWGDDARLVKALEKRIHSARREVQFYTYPDTKHWFMEYDRPEYIPKAAGLAWERTLEFLHRVLG